MKLHSYILLTIILHFSNTPPLCISHISLYNHPPYPGRGIYILGQIDTISMNVLLATDQYFQEHELVAHFILSFMPEDIGCNPDI
jgi:hypothetical protein